LEPFELDNILMFAYNSPNMAGSGAGGETRKGQQPFVKVREWDGSQGRLPDKSTKVEVCSKIAVSDNPQARAPALHLDPLFP
jgi:hypothetical protein